MRAFRLLRVLVIAIALFVPALMPMARAAELREELMGLASTDFGEIETAIAKIAATGDPQAAAVLNALGQGKLVYDGASKAVFVSTDSGFLDAATGNVVPGPANPSSVRVNNRIRRALEAASGSLMLVSKDP